MTDKTLPSTVPLTLMGVLLIVLGVIAVAMPAVAGKTVVMIIGAVLLLAGVVQIITGFRFEGWTHKLPALILGTIFALGGLGLLSEPWFGMTFIALLLAVFFVLEGIWKIVTSFSYRPASGWLMVLLSGLVTLVLGLLIWQQWPISGLWAVGVLVGVDLVMTGVSLVLLASTVRRLVQCATATNTE